MKLKTGILKTITLGCAIGIPLSIATYANAITRISDEDFTKFNRYLAIHLYVKKCQLTGFAKYNGLGGSKGEAFIKQHGIQAGWNANEVQSEIRRLSNTFAVNWRNDPQTVCGIVSNWAAVLNQQELTSLGQTTVTQKPSSLVEEVAIKGELNEFAKRNYPKIETALKCISRRENARLSYFVFIGKEGESLDLPKHTIQSEDNGEHEIETISEENAAYFILWDNEEYAVAEQSAYFAPIERKQKEFSAETRPLYYDFGDPKHTHRTEINLDRTTGALVFYQNTLNAQYRFVYTPLGNYKCSRLNINQARNSFSAMMNGIAEIANQKFEETEKEFSKETKF